MDNIRKQVNKWMVSWCSVHTHPHTYTLMHTHIHTECWHSERTLILELLRSHHIKVVEVSRQCCLSNLESFGQIWAAIQNLQVETVKSAVVEGKIIKQLLSAVVEGIIVCLDLVMRDLGALFCRIMNWSACSGAICTHQWSFTSKLSLV